MPESTAVAVARRSKFAELLASIGDGTLEADVSDQVVMLTQKLAEMGSGGGKQRGTITLKIAIVYDRGVFDVDSNVDVKEPKIVRPRTMMYAMPGGGLSRNNPQQIDAFTRDVADERPVRDVPLSVSR